MRLFGSLAASIRCPGDPVTSSPISHVKRVCAGGVWYYVKIYTCGGKGLRRFLGRSRAAAEWENLLYFRKLGIPTADLVAFGQRKTWGVFRQGALITREIDNCRDLAAMAKRQSRRLQDRNWLSEVTRQLAEITKTLHTDGFVHNDLKWRNVLVAGPDPPKVFLIDCPVGRKAFRFWRHRWIVKDLACLDKVAKKTLTRTQRLRFFMRYTGSRRLDRSQKRMIRKILRFFQGRE